MEAFSQCLLDLYDAAVRPGRWRHALDGVSKTTGARATMLRIRRPSGWAPELHLLDSRYLAFARSPAGLFYQMRYSHLQRPDWGFLSEQAAETPIWDVDAGYAAKDLDQRGDYAFLRKRLAVQRRLGVRLNADRLWFDGLSLGYAQEATHAKEKVAGTLAPLLPHIVQAAEMSRLFIALRKKYAAALAALDHVDLAMVILNPERQLILANDKGSALLAENQSFETAPDGRVRLRDAHLDLEFARLVARACATSAGEGDAAQSVLTVTAPNGQGALLCDVSPLKDAGREIDVASPACLVTMISPDTLPKVKMDRFAKMYGLSPAEEAVCALAFSARRIAEIAERRDTAEVTVKNQIASILNKTGTTSRLELMRLIIATHPAIK